MKNRANTPFNKSIFIACDDIADHVLQEINDLVSKILISALVINEKGETYDPNISLGATQKALALLISKFFKKEDLPEVVKNVCRALALSVKDFQGERNEE